MKEVTGILLTIWEEKLMALLSLITCNTSFSAVGGLVTSRRAHSYLAFIRYFLLIELPVGKTEDECIESSECAG